MTNQPSRSQDPQRGFSLLELIVVVGLIGVFSLVAVPNFIAFNRAGRLTSSVRQLASDIRGVRQRAVSRSVRTKMSFETGSDKRQYTIYDSPPTGTPVWTRIQTKEIDESSFFYSTTFTDTDNPANTNLDIIYRANGSVEPVSPPPAALTVVLRSIYTEIPYNQVTLRLSLSGSLGSDKSHY